ncbi:uncharacterized protein LOC116843885 [Odontomachus brunneus]|uniref:uncharacterized protein LOC116843885 n=1 Tax=Odontomachus brunneus TaxID=486640 RepID=UPI0013F285A7|nr:uncharacterized protein LOC116843885 [Odontomachus brunneus]
MDYEKYYKRMPDGTYSIHFPNKKGFSKEEIHNMFSPYGNVLSVTWKGDNINGLIFIKYKMLQETLYCLESLQKSNDIRILPQKDKIGKQKIQQSSNEWEADRMDNSLQETCVDKHHSNNTYINKNFTYEEKPTSHKRNSDCTDNFSDSSFSRPKHNYKSYMNAINSNKFNSLVVDEKNILQYRKQQNCNNKILPYNQIRKQQEIEFHEPSKSDVKYSIQDKDTLNGSKIPSLISDLEIKSKRSDIFKIDHSLNSVNNTSHKYVVILQEVIVANIHVNYGVHYILHLFEKRNPISATLVKTIFKTDIRYCSVYFMNAEDALAIEKEFDDFALSGKNLIVLRKSQLSKTISH